MESFENKIDGVFDFDITEEVKNGDVITEGIIEKAKELAKKAVSFGLEKVLPPEWLSFAQELMAAAKQSPEAVAEFLLGADQEKSIALVTASDSGAAEVVGQAVKEYQEKNEEAINEQSDAALAGAAEIGSALSKGAWVGLTVIGIIIALGVYHAVKTGIEIYKQTKKMEKAKARRHR